MVTSWINIGSLILERGVQVMYLFIIGIGKNNRQEINDKFLITQNNIWIFEIDHCCCIFQCSVFNHHDWYTFNDRGRSRESCNGAIAPPQCWGSPSGFAPPATKILVLHLIKLNDPMYGTATSWFQDFSWCFQGLPVGRWIRASLLDESIGLLQSCRMEKKRLEEALGTFLACLNWPCMSHGLVNCL